MTEPFVKRCCRCLLRVGRDMLIVLLLILFVPGLPPNIEYVSFPMHPIPKLEGVLSLNQHLNGVEQLYPGILVGPEGLDIWNNELYTGIQGGEIIKINNKGKVTPVAKIGKSCDGVWEQHICGRVLGLKFTADGNLYVVDAFYGIYHVDIETGTSTALVKNGQDIDGKPLVFPNNLDIASDGTIYFTESSTVSSLSNMPLEVFGTPTGRILKYDPKSNTTSVLADKVHFPNGIRLSSDESKLVVSETVRYRLLCLHLSGEKEGKLEIFLDGLIGIPDNIQLTKHATFLVPMMHPRMPDVLDVPKLFSENHLIKKFMARVIHLVRMPLHMADMLYPHQYFKQLLFQTLQLNVLLQRGTSLVLEVDEDGNILRSLWNTDGSAGDVSDIIYYNGYMYIGSPFNKFLGRVKLTQKTVSAKAEGLLDLA